MSEKKPLPYTIQMEELRVPVLTMDENKSGLPRALIQEVYQDVARDYREKALQKGFTPQTIQSGFVLIYSMFFCLAERGPRGFQNDVRNLEDPTVCSAFMAKRVPEALGLPFAVRFPTDKSPSR